MAKHARVHKKMCALTCCPCGLNLKALVPLVNAPKFICKSCGRVANAKANLCMPAKM